MHAQISNFISGCGKRVTNYEKASLQRKRFALQDNGNKPKLRSQSV